MDSIRKRIMLVDDTLASLMTGGELLKPSYEVFLASSAGQMFDILEHTLPDVILLDVVMPEMDGYEAIGILKKTRRFADIPVIFLTAMSDEESEQKGFDLGAVDYISKPFSTPLLLKRIENQLSILRQKAVILQHTENLERLVEKKTREVHHLQNAMLDTIADMMEFRDKFTGGHNARIQLYLKALFDGVRGKSAYEDKISSWDMNFLLPLAQLHDVGKIAIPDIILNKPGKLTPEEFEIMKTHVTIGLDAVKRIINKIQEQSFMDHALNIVGAHHEKWDGSGYPSGLKGENIPLEGRLMAFADVYDALTSCRPYKKAFTHEEAKEIIVHGSGTHFDPSLMEVFLRAESAFRSIARENKD